MQALQKLITELTEQPNPHLRLECALHDGTLNELIPELARLSGIPANPEHHPEVDTFQHMVLVMRAVEEMTNSPRARFATLVHDFGKGETPKDEWPQHIDHENRGVPLVEAFCARWNAPDDWKRLGMHTSKWHLLVHQCLIVHPRVIIKMLEQTGFIDDFDMFDDFLIACEADARGRLGKEDRQYPQRQYLLAAWKAINAVPNDLSWEDRHMQRCSEIKALRRAFK